MTPNRNKKSYRLADMSVDPNNYESYPDPDESSEDVGRQESMDNRYKTQYQARTTVAMLFRAYLSSPQRRAMFLKDIGAEQMPAILPALSDTRMGDIYAAARPYLDNGEESVIIPVGLIKDGAVELWMVQLTDEPSSSFWEIDSQDVHAGATMEDVVRALDPDKKWEITDLDGEWEENFRKLATNAT